MTVSDEVQAEIRRLFYVEHWKLHAIATQLQIHPDVVKRVSGVLSEKRLAKSPEATLLPFHDFLAEVLKKYPTVVSTRLYDMLRERGFRGSPRTVRRYVKTMRPVRIKEAFIQVETLPGEQAQVDWGHVGSIHVDGAERPLWMFVMVLSHSRAMWAELVLEQTVASVRRSLLRSVQYFGGCTRQWLFDNPKTIVLERSGDAARFHPTLLATTSLLKVEPRLCGVRRPQQKGKVERAIRFLKDRFFAARTVHSLPEGNADLLAWIKQVADARKHPIHPEKSVAECFEQERSRLLASPKSLPEEGYCIPVAVDVRARFQFDTNIYSAPSRYAATTQQLLVEQDRVALLVGSTVIAEHVRSWGRRQLVESLAHREVTLKRKVGAREPTARAQLIAQMPEIAQLFERWLRQGEPLHKRVTQCAQLAEAYGVPIVRKCVVHMLAHNTVDIGALNKLCEVHRRAEQKPVRSPVKLPPHVHECDVVPHALESYDE